MTAEEIAEEIKILKNKKTRSIYDFNKILKLEKELKEITNGTKDKEDE